MGIWRKRTSQILGAPQNQQQVEGEEFRVEDPTVEPVPYVAPPEPGASQDDFALSIGYLYKKLDFLQVQRLITGAIQGLGRLVGLRGDIAEDTQDGAIRVVDCRTDGYFVNTDINGNPAYYWVDTSGYLRQKVGSEPEADVDGQVIGPTKDYRRGCDIVYKSGTYFTATGGVIDINGITKVNDDAIDYLVAYTETLDQSQTTQDIGEVFGRSSTVMYAGQGFVTGTGAAGGNYGLSKIDVLLWKQGSPADNVTVSLRSAIDGSALQSVTVAGSTLGGAVGAATLDANFTGTTGAAFSVFGVNWRAQSFKMSANKPIVRFDLELYRSGSPSGNVVVDFHSSLTGSILGTASLAASTLGTVAHVFVTFNLGSYPYWLAGDTGYVVVSCPNGDSSNKVFWNTHSSGTYADGSGWSSGTSGVSWSQEAAYDNGFKVYFADPTFSYISFSTFEYVLAGSDQLYFTVTRSGAADPLNNYVLGCNSAGGYAGANNFERYSADGVTWTDRTWDACFKTYYKDFYAKTALWEGPALVDNSWYFVWAVPDPLPGETFGAVATRLSQPTTVTATVLTDSGASWKVDQLIGSYVGIVSGTGSVNWYPILDNTATTIAVAGWATTPTTGSYYMIQPRINGYDGRLIGQFYWLFQGSAFIIYPSSEYLPRYLASGGHIGTQLVTTKVTMIPLAFYLDTGRICELGLAGSLSMNPTAAGLVGGTIELWVDGTVPTDDGWGTYGHVIVYAPNGSDEIYVPVSQTGKAYLARGLHLIDLAAVRGANTDQVGWAFMYGGRMQ